MKHFSIDNHVLQQLTPYYQIWVPLFWLKISLKYQENGSNFVVHNLLLNTLFNLIIAQAIYISPNLSIDIIFDNIHLHHHGHNGLGHDCKSWPIMDMIMAMHTTEQNTHLEIEENEDNLYTIMLIMGC